MPEHVDWNAAARIPIAANSEPERSHFREQPLANANSAILMKARVVTECTKKQLQRFRLYNHFIRGIVNDEMREVRRSEEHTSLQSQMRISYAVFCLKTKSNHIIPKKQQNKQ